MAANSQFSIAVHILTMLAKNCDERVKSDYLAKSVNTNPVVIRRLLCNLQEAKLVVSQVGASGGTSLAKAPENIKLSEIYKAVSSGEIFSLHRKTPNQDCPVGKNIEAILCRLQKEIDKTIEEKLAEYSLRDIIGMVVQSKG
ncbi:MAG TPA: Rrf2 family transcriptional regulator [Pyrinomonadaceae bacterium]|jgi:Rrf2 family protein